MTHANLGGFHWSLKSSNISSRINSGGSRPSDKGDGEGGDHPVPRIGGGGGGTLENNFSRSLGPLFVIKIRWGPVPFP